MPELSQVFAGSWVLVTGASSGLGEEFARQLAAARANLILTARSRDKLEALARALAAQHGIAAEVIARDLGAVGGADALCDEVARLGHPVEHLISNAGFGLGGPVLKGDSARLGEMVRLNCEALVVLSRRLLPSMVERGRGGVLHVASIAGFQPAPFMTTYAATKAFVLSFSEGLAEELRSTGVRVCALCPGPVPTGFQAVAGTGIAPSQRRSILSAEETVRRGLSAYARGQAVYVPGGINKVSSLGSRILPRATMRRLVGNMMRAKGRA